MATEGGGSGTNLGFQFVVDHRHADRSWRVGLDHLAGHMSQHARMECVPGHISHVNLTYVHGCTHAAMLLISCASRRATCTPAACARLISTPGCPIPSRALPHVIVLPRCVLSPVNFKTQRRGCRWDHVCVGACVWVHVCCGTRTSWTQYLSVVRESSTSSMITTLLPRTCCPTPLDSLRERLWGHSTICRGLTRTPVPSWGKGGLT